DLDADEWIGRIVDVAGEHAEHHGLAADNVFPALFHRPADTGNVGRHATVDLPVVYLHQFRATLLPPVPGGLDLLAVRQLQGIGQHGPGIGLRLVVVRVVRRRRVTPIGTLADGRDAQLVH